jgi:hypothetical protein
MNSVVFAACLLLASSLAGSPASARDRAELILHKGARVGIVNLMDAEITHFQAGRLAQSFMKTYALNWQVDTMLADATVQPLTRLQLVPVPVTASDSLLRNRNDYFVNNSVAKGLPKDVARQCAEVASTQRLDALLVLVSGLNNSAQAAGGTLRKELPDYLRGWGFVTTENDAVPTLFDMTQVLLIEVGPDGAKLRVREWGGAYTDVWADYVAPLEPKKIPLDVLDQAQPLFARLLAKQAGHAIEAITVAP